MTNFINIAPKTLPTRSTAKGKDEDADVGRMTLIPTLKRAWPGRASVDLAASRSWPAQVEGNNVVIAHDPHADVAARPT